MKDYKFDVNPSSTNDKTFGCATIKSDPSTCPPCPMKGNGCFGENVPLKWWWDKRCFTPLKEALLDMRRLKRNVITRLWEVGDFPGSDGVINKTLSKHIAQALKNKRIVFGYTHYSPFRKNNLSILEEFNKSCTINLSANNLKQADRYVRETTLPVVSVCHDSVPNTFLSPDGNVCVVCPHEQFTSKGKRKVSGCEPCGNGLPLCARKDRHYIIIFRAHGARKKLINKLTERDLIQISLK